MLYVLTVQPFPSVFSCSDDCEFVQYPRSAYEKKVEEKERVKFKNGRVSTDVNVSFF